MQVAWTAVKNGWKKNPRGLWVKKAGEPLTLDDGSVHVELFGTVQKVSQDELRCVWGWASVYELDGEPVFDDQGDRIDEG
jgi:hypothetical protein